MEITTGVDCLNDKLDINSIAAGIVFYVPDEHQVVLEHDRTNRLPKLSKLPHVIMCNHYSDMSLNIPGGKIEKGESIVDGVNREFNEEVLGRPDYTLSGKPIFNETHFKFKKKGESCHNVYVFVRIIRCIDTYKNLMYDMQKSSMSILDSVSKWNSTDTFGGISIPIFMEVSDNNNVDESIGFPGLLKNIAHLHRSSLILCLLSSIDDENECVLTQEGRDYFLSKKYSYPGIPTICHF